MRGWFDELGVFDEWRNEKLHRKMCIVAQFFVQKRKGQVSGIRDEGKGVGGQKGFGILKN